MYAKYDRSISSTSEDLAEVKDFVYFVHEQYCPWFVDLLTVDLSIK